MADVEVKARLSVDTKDAVAGIGNVKKELGNSSGVFQNLQGSLKGLGPAFGDAAKGSGILNQAFNILKANPIILVVSSLVLIIVKLFEKFKQMEAVSDSLGKVFGILSGVFEKFINAILTPLIDGFVKIVELVSGGLITALDALGISSKETSERFGEITEALDDLEDAQKDSALAMAESNRKLQEARELAGDANVPIKERVAALREAARIEKEELDKVVEYNRQKASFTMESIAMELGARADLINKIREGSLESLKAARAELMSMKNVNKEKLSQIDAMIIAAENAAAQSAKISKKTQSAITGLEKEEQSKREAQTKAAADVRKKREEEEAKAAEDRAKLVQDAEKIIYDAQLANMDEYSRQMVQMRNALNEKLKALDKAGIQDRRSVISAYQKEVEAVNKKRLENEKQAEDKAEADRKAKQDKDIERLQAGQSRMLGVINAAQQDMADKQAATDKDKIEAEKEKQAQIGETIALTQNLGEVIGQQTVAGKALGIATAMINTYQGASEALKQKSSLPSPFDVIAKVANVAAIIATGLRTVRAIAGVNVPSSGGGGGGSASVAAPVTPITTSTSLNASTIQAMGNAANGGTARAYVVESDIANGQERIERLNRAARIG